MAPETRRRLAVEVMRNIARLDKERQRASAVSLRPYGLTLQQLWLLKVLPETAGMPIGAIAEALHCHGSNVTGMVDRLEARGLVARQPSPADRRVKHVVLTSAGRMLLGQVAAKDHPPASLDRLSDEELAALNHLLGKLCEGLD